MTFWEVLFVPARVSFFLEERRFFFFPFCLAAGIGWVCVCVWEGSLWLRGLGMRITWK